LLSNVSVFEDSGGSGLDEDEIAPAVERTPLRRNTRSLSSPMLVTSFPSIVKFCVHLFACILAA